jgi:hypothetical protein
MAATKVMKDEIDVNSNRPHYGALFYSTGGNTGGQVISNSETLQAFDVADSNSYGVTTTTGGSANITTTRAGVYMIMLHEAISDVSSTTFICWIDISLDGGTSYQRFRFPDDNMVSLTSGRTWSKVDWLPVGAIVRAVVYNGGGATRLAAPANTFNSRFYLGPKLSVIELGRSA